MGIGQLKCPVIDVNDLAVGEAFWSELTGLDVIPSVFSGRYSYLGEPDPWRHEMILHLVSTEKGEETNRAHVDIWVRDVDLAIQKVLEIGGRLKRPPVIYPHPEMHPGERPCLDWSVLQDPFGNEFCLISALTREEAEAVMRADANGERDDHQRRVAAGRSSLEADETGVTKSELLATGEC